MNLHDQNAAPLSLHMDRIACYLAGKRKSGVAESTIRAYQTPLLHLYNWLPEEKALTAACLQSWRASLEARGYGKQTVQTYVKYVNDFLRFEGHALLCIPKPPRNDLVGQTFGYLTVLERTTGRKKSHVVWRCLCRCGNEAAVPSAQLLRGHTTSCGCLNAEILQHCNRYEEGTALRQALEERIKNPRSVSGYVGVQSRRNKWTAYITYKKQTHSLGAFDTIEEAIKARARAKEAVMEDAARIYAQTDHRYGDAPRRPPRPAKRPPVHDAPVAVPVRRCDNTSGCTGVTMQYGKWNAKISYKGRRYPLGAYEKLEDAIAARKQAEQYVQADRLEALLSMTTGAGVINRQKRTQKDAAT